MFNRYAIGVRAHADGVGVKQSNVSFQAVRGITNRGQRNLEIVSIQSNCSCSAAVPKKQRLAPGESTDLWISVNVVPVGTKFMNLRVVYESRGDRTLEIPVVIRVAEAAAPWVVESPSELLISCDSVATHGEITFDYRVKENSANEQFLTGFVCSNDRIHLEIVNVSTVPAPVDNSLERLYTVRASVGVSMPPHEAFGGIVAPRCRGILTVPAKDIPILVRYEPRHRVIPNSFNFAIEPDSDDVVERAVLIVSRTERCDWTLAVGSNSPDWLRIEIKPLPSNIAKIVVQILPLQLRTTLSKSKGIDNAVSLSSRVTGESIQIPIRIDSAE